MKLKGLSSPKHYSTAHLNLNKSYNNSKAALLSISTEYKSRKCWGKNPVKTILL